MQDTGVIVKFTIEQQNLPRYFIQVKILNFICKQKAYNTNCRLLFHCKMNMVLFST